MDVKILKSIRPLKKYTKAELNDLQKDINALIKLEKELK